MIRNRIITTATDIPAKLAEEVSRALGNYNNQVPEALKIVFLEIGGIYYKGTIVRDTKGKPIDYHKLTIERMKSILTSSAAWKTRHRYSSTESGWMVKNGGSCPRHVAVFAVYELQPDDLPGLQVFRIGGRET